MAFPLWMLKYFLLIGGFGIFFSEGQFYGLVLGIIGLIWCVINWSNHEK